MTSPAVAQLMWVTEKQWKTTQIMRSSASEFVAQLVGREFRVLKGSHSHNISNMLYRFH